MSHVCYNGSFLETNSIEISIHDRAFNYGDGIFETIIFNNNVLKYWDDHVIRLLFACDKMAFVLPSGFIDRLKNEILQVAELNHPQNSCRIRVQVWRKQGGLYTPTDNSINYLIKTSNWNPQTDLQFVSLGISEKVKLGFSSFSSLKTCNSLPYILASIEREEQKEDELVLLDHQNNVVETIASNIFWLKNGQFFTPSLAAGCIDGIMRKNVLNLLNVSSYQTSEVINSVEFLKKSDGIFLSNVTGLRIVSQLNGIPVKTELISEILHKLNM